MKYSKFLFSAVLCVMSFTASAQDIFILEKNNGEKLEFNVSDIKELYFKDADASTGNLAPESVEAVDLGLSVAWASCNVGAEAPEQTGTFVQWGDTKPVSWYSWSYYKFGNAQNLTKYTVNDNQTVLQTEDDFASQQWGTDWRMPTMEECKELIDNCTVDYNATENGVAGVRFTSNKDGYKDKSIFFPLTGYKQDNNILSPTDVYVWASTVAQGFYQFASNIFSCTSGDYIHQTLSTANYRYLGMNVRAVTKVQPVADEDFVDLGLSVDWGKYNVGATQSEQPGIFVAWGETSEKEDYSLATYSFGSNAYSPTKYSKSDKKAVLDPEDDVVTVTKGEKWRMPTEEEVEELFAKCDVKYVVVNDVNCMQFTSKVEGHEGASIVIPFGGYKNGANTINGNAEYKLWTSSVVASGFRSSAYGYEGTAMSNVATKSDNRYVGRNVRGVRVK